MRKMMMAALFTAACGSIATPPAGNNNGSTVEAPARTWAPTWDRTWAPTWAPAPGSSLGMACRLGDRLQRRRGVRYRPARVRGRRRSRSTRWASSTTARAGGPAAATRRSRGTIANPAGASLEAYIGTTKVGDRDHQRHRVGDPAARRTRSPTADTRVTLRLVGATSTIEESQLFALDDKAPTATLVGSIKDERGDTIDFSTGEAVHTHAGAANRSLGHRLPVGLHLRLPDGPRPRRPTVARPPPNPLAWQVTVADSTGIDSMDSAYRVRDASGAVLYDWTSISPDAAGVYAVRLYRNKIPALGTKTGHMFVDARFRDPFGNESTKTACFDNHPMAAPFEIKPMQKAARVRLDAARRLADLDGFDVRRRARRSTRSTSCSTRTSRSRSRSARSARRDHVQPHGRRSLRRDRDRRWLHVSQTRACPAAAVAAPSRRTAPMTSSTNAPLPGRQRVLVRDGDRRCRRPHGRRADLQTARPSRCRRARPVTPHPYRIDFNFGVLGFYLMPPRVGSHRLDRRVLAEQRHVHRLEPGRREQLHALALSHLSYRRDHRAAAPQPPTYSEFRAVASMSVTLRARSPRQYTSATATAAYEPVAAYASAGVHVPAMTWERRAPTRCRSDASVPAGLVDTVAAGRAVARHLGGRRCWPFRASRSDRLSPRSQPASTSSIGGAVVGASPRGLAGRSLGGLLALAVPAGARRAAAPAR